MIKPESSSDFKDVDNPYIIQEIEISDESDPEELEDIPSFEDNPIDDQDIEDLDRLMIATAKSISSSLMLPLFYLIYLKFLLEKN